LSDSVGEIVRAVNPQWFLDIEPVLQKASELRQELDAVAEAVRGETAKAVDGNLVNGKWLLLATVKLLQAAYPYPPVIQTESDKERLILLLAFVQGHAYVEELIAEGQYIKACSVLRQDYEILTRMRELRGGVDRRGEVPNIKHAPEGTQRFYSQLTAIAHPATPLLLLNFLRGWEGAASDVGISHLPHFVAPLASHLMTLHVWMVFEVTREALLLFMDLYGEDSEALKRAEFEFNRAILSLEQAGLVIS